MKKDQLHPDFPVIKGQYQITEDWKIFLPEKFNRRFEDNQLVIWKPGFTIWIVAWENNKNESIEIRQKHFLEIMSSEAFELEKESSYFSYRLTENHDGDIVHAYYGLMFNQSGHIQMGMYFDDESDLKLAKEIFKSIERST